MDLWKSKLLSYTANMIYLLKLGVTVNRIVNIIFTIIKIALIFDVLKYNFVDFKSKLRVNIKILNLSLVQFYNI